MNVLRPKIKLLESSFTENSFFSKDWLLIYEGAKKGWFSLEDLLNKNLFFRILKKYNVEFYETMPIEDMEAEGYLFDKVGASKEIKEKAMAMANRIYEETIKRRINEIKEDTDDIGSYFEDEDSIEDIEADLREIDILDGIYQDILAQMIQDDDVNISEEDIISQYLYLLKYYAAYNE